MTVMTATLLPSHSISEITSNFLQQSPDAAELLHAIKAQGLTYDLRQSTSDHPHPRSLTRPLIYKKNMSLVLPTQPEENPEDIEKGSQEDRIDVPEETEREKGKGKSKKVEVPCFGRKKGFTTPKQMMQLFSRGDSSFS